MVLWKYAAVTAGSSLLSGFFGRKSAKKAANKEEEYLNRLLDYQNTSWDMNKSLTIAKRNEAIRGIDLAKSNEAKFAAFKDANNMQAHKYAVSIWNYQNQELDRQYAKSEALYQDSLSLNAQSAQAATEDEMRALQEEKQKYAFENEESVLANLVATGTLAASGVQGRSAQKQAQSQMAALGRNQAIMTESLVSADRNTRSNLKNIGIELQQANTLARSRRMLKPKYAPKPLEPIKTPISDYEYPRPLSDFDFGPRPIKGQSTVNIPSWGSVFANAAGSAFTAYAGKKWGGIG